MISYKEAIRKLYKANLSIKSEKILSEESLYRICSENIYSKINYPSANNTAFDGFAISSNETKKANKNKEIKLKILKTIAAGDNPNIKKIPKYSCVEVMTGAIIKKPFDTIIPYEKSKVIKIKKNSYLIVSKKIKKFNNLRFSGSDYKKGQIVLCASVAGYTGLPGSCAYGPTKSALNNVAESAFVEFKAFKIDISLVCPGFVDTRLTKKK